jgi:hypothetical protein
MSEIPTRSTISNSSFYHSCHLFKSLVWFWLRTYPSVAIIFFLAYVIYVSGMAPINVTLDQKGRSTVFKSTPLFMQLHSGNC